MRALKARMIPSSGFDANQAKLARSAEDARHLPRPGALVHRDDVSVV